MSHLLHALQALLGSARLAPLTLLVLFGIAQTVLLYVRGRFSRCQRQEEAPDDWLSGPPRP